MAFVKNLFIIAIVIIIVVLILNHYFFQTNILYDGMLTAQTYKGGIQAQVNALQPYGPGAGSKVVLPSGSTIDFYNKNLGKTGKIVDNSKFPITTSNNFMYSIWFFIDDYTVNLDKFKIISSIIGTYDLTQCAAMPGSNVFYSSLDLVLSPYNNNLGIGIATSTSGSCPYYSIYWIQNIPLQKWNCVTISVSDRTMDVYLEGKLISSYILEGFYMQPTKQTLYLGNNFQNYFNGFITRARYQSGGISPQDAYNIYKEGINSSTFGDFLNKYRLRIGLYEYGNPINTFEI